MKSDINHEIRLKESDCKIVNIIVQGKLPIKRRFTINDITNLINKCENANETFQ